MAGSPDLYTSLFDHVRTMKAMMFHRPIRYLTLVCILLFPSLLPTRTLAELAIAAPGTGDLGPNSGLYTYGWVFTLGTKDLLVGGLGVWDDGQDGLVAPHPVGIWSDTGELLATTIIPSGTGAPLVGDFRVQALATAVTLTGGVSYTIGALYQSDDNLQGSFASEPTVSPLITGLEGRFVYSQSLTQPIYGAVAGAGTTPYVGPTFQFTTVPEPSSFALLGAALLTASGVFLKRRAG